MNVSSFLSVGTIMQFANTDTHGRVTFSPPLIYSWTHGIINVCLIIWATIQRYFVYFDAQNFKCQILETLLIGSVLVKVSILVV